MTRRERNGAKLEELRIKSKNVGGRGMRCSGTDILREMKNHNVHLRGLSQSSREVIGRKHVRCSRSIDSHTVGPLVLVACLKPEAFPKG